MLKLREDFRFVHNSKPKFILCINTEKAFLNQTKEPQID